MQAIALNGIALCDHPAIGSLAWWASGIPARQAARRQMTILEWIQQQGHVLPQPQQLVQWGQQQHAAGQPGQIDPQVMAASQGGVAPVNAGGAGPSGAAGGVDGDGPVHDSDSD